MTVPRTTPARRRLKPEHRRELILQGAMDLFANRGYERTSMSDIAQAASITPAVIYDHFSSKAQLAVELLERQTADLLSHVGAALEKAPANASAQMRAGVDAFFTYVHEHRSTWRLMFRDPPLDPDVAAAHRRLNGQATAAIALFLQNGDTQGALDAYDDPTQAAEMFAEALKAAQNGLASWWYEHPEVPREQIVERLLDFAWGGLERLALNPAAHPR
jgi:AcrR family transcriptional regulator